MRVILGLGHPAHFHLFKNLILSFKRKSISFKIVINDKDILCDLLTEANLDYYLLANREERITRFSKLKRLVTANRNLNKVVKKYNPTLLMGCIPQIGHVGFINNISSIFFAEDDFKATYLQGLILYPFIEKVITPNITDIKIFRFKKIGYKGYHELAYLSPGYFKPDISRINKYIDTSKKFYLLRFARLSAHHDFGKKGISIELTRKIIEIFKPLGNIYITSEIALDEELEKYRIKVPSSDIHHALYFAELLICDSQTMAAEAAVLGTPSLRFNDFVGKLGYLEELEHKYGLTYGIKTDQPDQLLNKIRELLANDNLKTEWQKKRKIMLEDMIDVTAFMVWLIENYPQSVQQLKDNPDIQNKFK